MDNKNRTKEQLLQELSELREENAELRRSEDERRQEKALLKESEALYRTAIEHSNDGVIILAGDERFYCNKKYLEILGYTSREEISDKPLFKVVHPDDMEMVADHARRRQRGEQAPSSYECRLVRKNGTTVHVAISASAIVYKDRPASLGFIRDITEQKKAEEALRSSEGNLRTILDSVNDAIFIHNMDGKIIDMNSKMLEMYRVTREEVFSMSIENDFSTPDNPLGMLRGVWDSVIKGEKKAFEWKARRPHDGSSFHVEVFLGKITLAGADAILATVHDITERKRIEEERLGLERRLLDAQKLESVGTLAGGIAHDFNNLLMGIQGYVSLMIYDMDISHPHFQKLKNIEELVRSGSDLTGKLLGFAQRGKYEVRSTDLNALINETADMFGRTKKEITIHKDLAGGLPRVEVDRGQIEQVLVNLYLNAWQAMPGGGDLYLRTKSVLLEEVHTMRYSARPGKYVKVTVSDTGVGMDEATQRRIFEPFFTTREMGRGSGLGLASAYGVIKNHSGIIEVSSERERGTTFTIYLPVHDREPRLEKSAPVSKRKGSGTVLVVDDQEMLLEISSAMLQALGYEVLSAGSGQKAVDLYAGRMGSIDIVILDMVMPGLSGEATYDRLKEMDPDVKVILSSGYSLDGQAAHILERGCNGFIQKPFNLEALSKKINEVLGKL